MTRAELAQEKRNALVQYKALLGVEIALSHASQSINFAVKDEKKRMSLLKKISEMQHTINKVTHELLRESQKNDR